MLDGLSGGDERELGEPIHPASQLVAELCDRIETLDLGRDPGKERASIETGDWTDPGTALQ
jgi:hypothetical protein